jgi:integrase
VEQLVEDHLAAGYKPASVQSYIAYLRAAMRYACRRENRSLASLPYFPTLKIHNARQGFFESEEFEAILVGLPEPYADIARFGYATGWRLSEILNLQWAQVDRERRVIRLPCSKNGEGRIIPLIGERLALIERQWRRRAYRNRLVEWVFHRKGRRVSRDYLWRHWMWARTEAGLPHKLFHDLRRTFARDFIEAGGDYKTAMNITGHKTMRTFLRYQITDMRGMERGLEAMDAKRNGAGAARKRKG